MMTKELLAHIIIALTLFGSCVYLLVNRWNEVKKQEEQKHKQ